MLKFHRDRPRHNGKISKQRLRVYGNLNGCIPPHSLKHPRHFIRQRVAPNNITDATVCAHPNVNTVSHARPIMMLRQSAKARSQSWRQYLSTFRYTLKLAFVALGPAVRNLFCSRVRKHPRDLKEPRLIFRISPFDSWAYRPLLVSILA